ncbi:MAG: 4-(cytidine 5'-diphospho)-2-C-methyl-D-erythritol kinase [Planctomycetota bacterium]|nr:4-(cytidine 5'-diphospho)-2-C-methyl-D-erythritol kinase [Planctomycetota bacterium]
MRSHVTCTCPAKLNLALAVDAAGPEGLHPIASWMVTVDFVDDLAVTMLEEGYLSRYAVIWHEDAPQTSEIDWSITDDLAVRAHMALEAHVGHALPVQVKLQKRIPVGGGLGGGSADAAGMLRALNRLFDLDLDPGEMESIALGLGSDVPFMLRGGSAMVSGVGETIEYHEQVPEFHAMLVLPAFSCSTGAVYKAFDEGEQGTFKADTVAGAVLSPPDPSRFFNDLAEPATRVAPPLGVLMGQVQALAELPVHVSGSGSTLFVPCTDAQHAAALGDRVFEQLGVAAVPVAARAIESELMEST